MCNQKTSLTKLQKCGKNHIYFRLIYNHILCDACKLGYFLRYALLRIYKSRKFIYNLAPHNLYSTNFYNSAVFRSKTCSLYIKNHSRICKLLPLIHPYSGVHIIYKIAFYPVYKLKILHFKLSLCMKCIGKTLYHSMIGQSDCTMSPF